MEHNTTHAHTHHHGERKHDNEFLAMLPSKLLEKYQKSFNSTCEQRAKDHFEVYTGHLKVILAENEKLKESNEMLKHTVSVCKRELACWKEENIQLESSLAVVTREGEKWQRQWKKCQDSLREKEDHLLYTVGNLERYMKQTHDKEKKEMDKKFDMEMKAAHQQFERNLSDQKREAQQEVARREADIRNLKSDIEEQRYLLKDKTATIKGLEATLAEEKEHYENLLRMEKQKANAKVDKLQRNLDYLKECYEALVAMKLEKKVSALTDDLTRTNVIVKQRDEEVEVARKETDRLHNVAAYVEMSNVELNLRLVNKVKRVSALETRLEMEMNAHRDTRRKVHRTEARIEELQREHDFVERKAFSLEKETLVLQQKVKRLLDICQNFQLDLQGCVDVMLDRPQFQLKFRELAQVYLDQEKVAKLGNVLQGCEGKIQQVRTIAENMRKNLRHENHHLRSEMRRVEENSVTSFLVLREYNSKLVEDLGLLREQYNALEFSHAEVQQQQEQQQQQQEQQQQLPPQEQQLPAKQEYSKLGSAKRVVKRQECMPVSRRKKTKYRTKQPTKSDKGRRTPEQLYAGDRYLPQPGELSFLVCTAKIHPMSRKLGSTPEEGVMSVSEVKAEDEKEVEGEEKVEAKAQVLVKVPGTAFPTLPPISTSTTSSSLDLPDLSPTTDI